MLFRSVPHATLVQSGIMCMGEGAVYFAHDRNLGKLSLPDMTFSTLRVFRSPIGALAYRPGVLTVRVMFRVFRVDEADGAIIARAELLPGVFRPAGDFWYCHTRGGAVMLRLADFRCDRVFGHDLARVALNGLVLRDENDAALRLWRLEDFALAPPEEEAPAAPVTCVTKGAYILRLPPGAEEVWTRACGGRLLVGYAAAGRVASLGPIRALKSGTLCGRFAAGKGPNNDIILVDTTDRSRERAGVVLDRLFQQWLPADLCSHIAGFL